MITFFYLIWSLFNASGYSHPNVTDPQPNDVFHLGWNVAPGGGRQDPSQPAWMMSMESWYEVSPGSHLHEWHIQWRGTDGTGRRPLSVALNPETATGNVGVFGSFGVHDELGAARLTIQNGTIWTYANMIRAQPDQPALMGLGNAKFVEVARVTSKNDVVVGLNADAVQLGPTRPVVTSCDDLITALADIGIIEDGR